MSWVCPSCGTEWGEQPLAEGTIGCPECGNAVTPEALGMKRDPTAISGTWRDIESRARFLYQYDDAEPRSDRYEMAEALLVMLAERDTLKEQRDQAERERSHAEHGLAETADALDVAEARAEALEAALREIAAGKFKTVGKSDPVPTTIDRSPATVQMVERVEVDAVGIARAALTRSGQQEKSND